MTMSKFAGILLVIVRLSWATSAQAIAPPYMSDEELADLPVIVVAKWEKAPFHSHIKYDQDKELGRVVRQFEAYTKLKVLRTVKGNVPPGDVELLVNYGISWHEDGKWVTSGTSTELPGDVEDVTTPNLWFLTKARSWDSNRKKEYLSVDNYRQIQPLVLEKCFVALGSPRRETLVPQLLATDSPEVAMRVLRYISGGIWPWPYDPDAFEMRLRHSNPEHRGRTLKEESQRVWSIVKSNAGKSRPYAVSVYADLKGRDSIKDIRTLLDDKDPIVRGVAIGILVRYEDGESLERINKAIRGVDKGWLACKLIDALSSWEDERVVPCLISYLQNSSFAYQHGDDLGIPAIKARQALKDMTGHWFPFDVDLSMKAWRQARQIPDKVKRRELLNQLIPGEEFPFIAELVGKISYKTANDAKQPAAKSSLEATGLGDNAGSEQVAVATVRLRNITKRPVVVGKRPTAVDMSSPNGCAYYGNSFPTMKPASDQFVQLTPGGTLDFEVTLSESFRIAEPHLRHLKVIYHDNGNTVGVNAWIGTLEVKPGTEWNEERKTEKVEETWPNGNLKVTGTKMNGHRVGEWTYYNEQGDRIRVENPAEGKVAVCNPDHPDNKGAGIRVKK
jgi:hypothetical protein